MLHYDAGSLRAGAKDDGNFSVPVPSGGVDAKEEARALLRPHDRLRAEMLAKLLQALPLRNAHGAELHAAAERADP